MLMELGAVRGGSIAVGTVTQSGRAGWSAMPKAPPPPVAVGLLGWFRANGTNRVGPPNAVAFGAPGLAAGVTGAANTAAALTGSTHYYYVDSLLLTGPPLTLAGWFKQPAGNIGLGGTMMGLVSDGGAHLDVGWNKPVDDVLLTAYAEDATSAEVLYAESAPLAEDAGWHHLAVTLTAAGVCRLYYDGEQIGFGEATAPVVVGAPGDTDWAAFTQGLFHAQNFGVWGRALPVESIRLLADPTNPFDPTV